MTEKTVARNEPCPCGSGKKYKRCHGVEAEPLLSKPAAAQAMPATSGDGATAAPAGMPAGFDPSQIDQKAMMQVMQAMQRLPRGQQQRLQSLVQRAMAGKDVAREMAEFERTLPPNFQQLMTSLAPQLMPGMMQMAQSQQPAADAAMSEEEAKRIVAEAAKAGKISSDQAEELLGAASADAAAQSSEGGGKLSKLWKSIKGS